LVLEKAKQLLCRKRKWGKGSLFLPFGHLTQLVFY
jgi:hypothetical protein